MRQANKSRSGWSHSVARVACALLVFAVLMGGVAAQAQTQGAPTSNIPWWQLPLPEPGAGVATSGVPTQPAPNQPGDTTRVPAPAAGTKSGNDVYLFKAQVEEVTLHATVVDQHQRLITGLGRQDFQVYEDGQPQAITSFRQEDIPVSLGILIDNSGSMRDKRPSVNRATLNLIRASNQQDEVFVVNFNDEPFLDQDFTSNVNMLKEALDKIDSRGGTAMYDAVIASAEHLAKSGKQDKKVLLVITDGEDNASRESLERAIRRVQAENGPTIYSIGILGAEKQRRAKRALEALALQTGGVAFFPKDVNEVDAISQAIAHDIRNQYTIQYKPTNPQSRGGYRTVKVESRASGYGKLQVRTRSGYYAGGEQRSSN